MTLLVLAAPAPELKFEKVDGVDEVSEFLIWRHGICLVRGVPVAVFRDKALKIELDPKGKVLARYEDGVERTMRADGSFEKLNVPLHYPLMAFTKAVSLRQRLNPKDDGKVAQQLREK
jgi:hypothetical protein